MFIIIFKLFYLFCFSKLIINTICVDIHNEKEFIENINNAKEEEVLKIHDEITINSIDSISLSIKKISILGSSKKDSIINFKNNDNINLLFSKQCQHIVFENIHIIGNLRFTDNKEITFKNVIHHGYYLSEHTSMFNMTDCDFYLPNLYQGYEIINGNADIYNCTFHGNDLYNVYMLKYETQYNNTNSIKIDLSLFDGNYHNSALSFKYGSTTIYSSRIQNSFNCEFLKG